jgi:uncharacterized protein (UPF0335 family)
MSDIGHNSGVAAALVANGIVKPPTQQPVEAGGIAAQKLRVFVDKIERLEAEKADIATDIRDVYSEAKGNGFDTKIMRKIIALKKLPDDQRKEQDEMVDLYRQALGI